MITCPKCGFEFQDGWQLPEEYKGLHFTGDEVTWEGGTYHLRPMERRLFRLLVQADGRIVRYGLIENYLYGCRPHCEWPSFDSIKVRVSEIRKGMRGAPLQIKTLRSVGYCLV